MANITPDPYPDPYPLTFIPYPSSRQKKISVVFPESLLGNQHWPAAPPRRRFSAPVDLPSLDLPSAQSSLPRRPLTSPGRSTSWRPQIRMISLQSLDSVGGNMANLIVRNVDEDIIKALKSRAGRHGTSAEAEHRKILAQALLKRRKRSFAQVLAAMPNVGKDSDFKRVQDKNSPNVLD